MPFSYSKLFSWFLFIFKIKLKLLILTFKSLKIKFFIVIS